ncbi:unnamed protein product, partial [Amoebophrya sp. A25]
ISNSFRRDIIDFILQRFGRTGCDVAVELGVYKGETTALLSRYCHQVWAIDDSLKLLADSAIKHLRQRKNILFFRLHSFLDTPWTISTTDNADSSGSD